MSDRRFTLVVVVVSAVLLLGLGYAYQRFNTLVVTPLPAVDCPLEQQACQATLPNGATVKFTVSPRGIPQLQPLKLNLQLTGMTAQQISVDFKGVDMNMGLFPYPLQTSDGQHFHGQGMLSACIFNEMHWLAHVQITTDTAIFDLPFPFTTLKK